jgi:antitoxin VapB
VETAKLFMNGQSQAVRLPKSCRFACEEVAVKKVGDIVVLYRPDSILQNFLQCEPLTDDVYESILDARKKDAERAVNQFNTAFPDTRNNSANSRTAARRGNAS